MKLIRLLLASVIVALFMGVSNKAIAQTTATIGAGTSASGTNDNSGPIYRSAATSSFNFSRHVMLYTAADLVAAGIIPGATVSKVAWYKTTAFTLDAGRTASMNILMQNSGATDLTTGTWDSKTLSMTNVYANAALTDADIPTVAGWVEFVLTTPFVYTGGALEIATDWEIAVGSGNASTGSFQWEYTTTTGIQSVGTSSSAALSGTTGLGSSFLRNMNVQLTYTGGTAPSCLSPTALSAAASATSAVLNWTANNAETAWDIEYGLGTFTQGSGTTVSVTSNPYTLSALTGDTTYKYYVRAVCSAGDLSLWAGPFTFTTPCVASTVPYFEGFESGYTNNAAVAGCLSQESINGPSAWTANSTQTDYNRAPYAGAWNAFLRYGNDNWLFIPIDLTGGTSYTFGAFARQDGALVANADVTVSYGTANNAAAMTNAIVAATGIVDGAYQQLTGVFTPATTGTYYMGIKGFMNGSPWYISLDDISVITTPICTVPNSLTAVNITATGATLGWTAGGTETAWDVEYGTAGFTQSSGTMVSATANTYALSTLSANSTYDYYVRAVCGAGDLSVWEGPFTFTTPCVAFTAPFTENFDGLALTSPYTALPNCWDPQVGFDLWEVTNDVTNDVEYLPNIGDHTSGSGNYMWIDASGPPPGIYANEMVTPMIDMSGLTAPFVGFWFASNNTDTAVNHSINLDAWDGTAWVNLSTLSGNFAGWVEVSTIVPASIPSTTKFRIYASPDLINTGTFYNDLGIDDFFIMESPSCIAPSAIMASNITTTDATLGWTAGGTETAWDVEYGTAGFTQGSGITVSATTNTYALSTLSANNEYDYYVRAVCGAGDLSLWVGPFTFTTLCGAFTAPFTENFDGLALTSPYFALPNCWNPQVGPDFWGVTNDATNDGEYLPNIGDHTSGSGNYMWIDASGAAPGIDANEMVTPMIDMSGLTAPFVGFWFASNNTNSAINNSINLDAWDGTAWVNLATLSGNFAGWVEVSTTVPASIPSTTKFRIYASPDVINTGDAFYNDLGIDDFFVMESPSCVAPSALMASNITTTDATLGWTAGGTETAWDVEYGTAGFTQGSGITVSATANTYALSTLSANNEYDYYVRAVCSAGDLSLWAGPFTFTTPCVASTVPYFEGFESGYTDNTAVAGCLSQESINGTTYWKANSTQTNYNRSPYAGAWNAFLRYGNEDWLFIPIDLTGGTSYTFGAFVRQDGATATDSNVTVSYGTANNAATMTNAIVPATGIVNGAYQQLTGVFTPATTGIYYIGIKGAMNGSPWYISLDDISVITTPICTVPNSLTAVNITATGATLGWTAGGTETAWDVEYGTAGFTQSSGTMVSATANTYALSTLSANSTYDYYVRAVCGAGDLSVWEGPFTFTTPCVASTVPYFEGFESGYTNNTAVAGCLSQESVNGTTDWTANNTLMNYNRAPYSGAWNAFLQYNNEDWLFIPIDLTGGTSYTFGAFVRQDGATATDSNVTVSYGTANNAATMTNAIVPATGIVNGAYQQLTGVFTPATTDTYYIGIKGAMNGSPWYISLDDISVITSPNCSIPNALTVANITTTGADLGWTENGVATSWEVEYGVTGFTPGSGTAVVVAANSYAVTGLTFETDYQFYVRAICAPGDTSPWSQAGSFFTGYCIPAPDSVDGMGITNVTMGGINNTTGIETGNYGNYSAMVANAPQGGTLPIDITLQTGFTYHMWAWVDWNNNLDFTDAGEEFFLGTSTAANPTTFTTSIAIPASAALGNYRIRIGGADTGLGVTSPSFPCYTGSWASFEDYTLNVDNSLETTRVDYITSLSIYPNPASGNTVIDLELFQNADVAFAIYTLTGALVQDFGKENTSKATHIIDVSKYSAGMYLVQFVVNNQLITKKLIVTK